MQVVKDHFGTEVSIGDYLVQITKESTSVSIHYCVVYGFIWRGDNNTQVKVASVEKTWKGTLHYYLTTLTVDNFVRITSESIPDHIRLGLLNRIKI